MMKILVFLAATFLSACSIPIDKQLHIGVGSSIAGVSSELGGSWEQSCAVSAIAGLAKEAYDSTGRGTVDGMDFVATAVSGCVVAYTIERLR